MRKVSYLFTLLLLVSPVLAIAQKMDPFDLHVASLKVLEDRSVQRELGVTAAQRDKMNEYANTYNTELKAYQAQRQKDHKMPTLDDTVADMLDKVKQNVMAVLSPSQLRRLREISLQAFGLNGIMDDTVAKRVGLSTSQLSKMRKTYADGSKQANDIMSKAMQPVNQKFKVKPKNAQQEQTMENQYVQQSKLAMSMVMPQVQKVNDQTQAQMLGIITSKQRAAYLALQGKPFHTPAAH